MAKRQFIHPFVYLYDKRFVMNAIKVAKRLKSGPVFLRNNLEGTVIRSVPGEDPKFFAKFPGEKEYKIHYSTKMVNNALLEWDEITESEYMNF